MGYKTLLLLLIIVEEWVLLEGSIPGNILPQTLEMFQEYLLSIYRRLLCIPRSLKISMYITQSIKAQCKYKAKLQQ